MAYATTTDLISRFGEAHIARLSTAEGASVVAVDSARCDQAIASAAAFADSYLRAQVTVPMTSVPTVLVDMVCDLARYNLASSNGRVPTDEMSKRRDIATAWLRDVSSGRVQLADTVPSAGAQGGRYSDRDRVLSNDSLRVLI
jgi:phage gp36-like protein